jgi:Ran GTPase-activating protein (RanGAP) involved in mRNA processing and transport
VHKFGLLLTSGSRTAGTMVPLLYPMTWLSNANGAQLEAPEGYSPYDELQQGDVIRIVPPGGGLPTECTVNTATVTRPRVLNTNLTRKHRNKDKKMPDCTVLRAAVRMVEVQKHMVPGFKIHGIQKCDISCIAALLRQKEVKAVLAAAAPNQLLSSLIDSIARYRNTLVGHLLGGAVPDKEFSRLCRAFGGLLDECGAAAPLGESLIPLIDVEHFKRSLAVIQTQSLRGKDLVARLPAKNLWDAAKKANERIKMFTQKQKQILMTITQSGDRRFSIQAPPGSGKTLLWLHLAILFVHGRLKLETRSTKRFLMLTHDPALANTFASIVAAETEQVLEVAPVRIDPPPVPGAVVLVWGDARGHSTEVHVCSVDAFVQWQTGIQHPYVRQECPPRLQSAPLYCSVAVDEGHRVFSYQPHAHITGQHNLRTIDHVRQILHHASDPDCQLVFFHDKDYQSIGSPIADPDDCSALIAGLTIVRCPGAARDLSVPYSQMLTNGGQQADGAAFVPLHDESNTGPDVVFVDTNEHAQGRMPPTLQIENAATITFTLGGTANQEPSGVTKVSVAEYTDALLKSPDRLSTRLCTSFDRHYAPAIVYTLCKVYEQLVQHGGGWGNVAILVPGSTADLPPALLKQCRVEGRSKVPRTDPPKPKWSTAVAEALEGASAVAGVQSDGVLFFGAAENFAGFEREVVIVTGFHHPLALMAQVREVLAKPSASSRVDYRLYVAVTRTKCQLYVVEPDADVFASHFRLRDCLTPGASGGVKEPPLEGRAGPEQALSVHIVSRNHDDRGLLELKVSRFAPLDYRQFSASVLVAAAGDSATPETHISAERNVRAVLASQPAVEHLDLSRAAVEDVRTPFEGMSEHHRTAVEDSTWRVLFSALSSEDCTVTSIDGRGNPFGVGAAIALANLMRTRPSLAVDGFDIFDMRDQIADAEPPTVADVVRALVSNLTVTTVDLRLNGLGPKAAADLAGALRVNSIIVTVNLMDNDVGDAGAVALLEAIAHNECSAVRSLNLSRNSIRGTGLANVSAALTSAKSHVLATLSLKDNAIDDVGAKVLAGALRSARIINHVDLKNNKIKDDGAVAIAELLRAASSVCSVDLRGNDEITVRGGAELDGACVAAAGAKWAHAPSAVVASALAQLLDSVTSAITIDLQRWRSAAKITALCTAVTQCRVTSLKIRGLRGLGVGTLPLPLGVALAQNHTITSLSLNLTVLENAETDALAEALKANVCLTSIDLSHNKIGDVGVKALAEALKVNAYLTSIDLSHNKIGDVGVKALAEALKDNAYLTSIDLSHNTIGNTGATALGEGLKVNTCLTSIDLQDNKKIGKVGAAALIEVITTRSDLRIDCNQSVARCSAVLVNVWGNRPTSICLGSRDLRDLGATVLAAGLRGNTYLTVLDIHNNGVEAAGGVALANGLNFNACLTTLNLHGNRIGHKGALALAEGLKKVNVCLTTLDLAHNQIGDTGAKALAEGLKVNVCLTSIDLSHNQIGDTGVKALADGLKINTCLTTLDLQDNLVDDAGAQALATVLKVNICLRSLNLAHNQVEDAGAIALAEGLKVNTCRLTTLNLQDNLVDDAGAQALATVLKVNICLRSLNLAHNQVEDAGAIALAEGLKVKTCRLTTLDLQGNLVGNAGLIALAEALKVNTCLTTINLGHNQFGVAGTAALTEGLMINTCLTTLDLQNSGVGNVEAAALAKGLVSCRYLTMLDLRDNDIGDEVRMAFFKGMVDRNDLRIDIDIEFTEFVAAMGNLRRHRTISLDLQDNTIRDDGTLAESSDVDTSITSINLRGNQIGDAGAAVLAEELQVNTCLTSIDLRNNEIGDTGAAALATGLMENTSLTTINLRSNQIGDTGAKALAEGLKFNTSLTSIDLQYNRIGDIGATALATGLMGNTSLITINLQDNQIGENGAVALAGAFKNNKCVTTLHLGSNQIGDVGATALAVMLEGNTCLSHISLHRNWIGDVGVAALVGFTSVYGLQKMAPCSFVNDIVALRDNRTTSLRLAQNFNGIKGGLAAVAHVLKVNTSLITLDLQDIQIGELGAVALAKGLNANTSLLMIDLQGNNIGDAGTAALAEGLGVNTCCLVAIDLQSNEIGDIGAEALANGLKVNTSVAAIDLSGNLIGHEGAAALAEGLKVNTCRLAAIDLQNNKIGNLGAKALATALKVNTCLRTIDLQNNGIGSAGVTHLAEGITANKCLTAVDLTDNDVGDDGATVLAEVLKKNTCLTSLGLQRTTIGEVGAIALADGLKVNTSLAAIDLSCNQIGDKGAFALAEWLKKVNVCLTTLDLAHNQIGDKGADSLAEGLEFNTSLTTINLGNNQIGDTGAQALTEMLSVNRCLTNIELDNNLFGDAGAAVLISASLARLSHTMRNLRNRGDRATVLNLQNSRIGEAGLKVLAEGLKVNTTLTTLDLSSNNLKDSGAMTLAELLQITTSLTTVHLADNQIGDMGTAALNVVIASRGNLQISGVDGAERFSSALAAVRRNVTTSLDLQDSQVGNAGAVALGEGLKVNTSLTSIDLQDNKIGDTGAAALAKGLMFNTSLARIDLSSNVLGNIGAKAMATVLTGLTAIALDDNQIGDEGAKALATRLKVNTCRTNKIDLGVNEIGDTGAKALAEGLKVNTSLTSIDLQYNRIGDIGAKALAEGLKVNTSLITINLGHNQFGVAGRAALAMVSAVNPAVTIVLS